MDHKYQTYRCSGKHGSNCESERGAAKIEGRLKEAKDTLGSSSMSSLRGFECKTQNVGLGLEAAMYSSSFLDYGQGQESATPSSLSGSSEDSQLEAEFGAADEIPHLGCRSSVYEGKHSMALSRSMPLITTFECGSSSHSVANMNSLKLTPSSRKSGGVRIFSLSDSSNPCGFTSKSTGSETCGEVFESTGSLQNGVLVSKKHVGGSTSNWECESEQVNGRDSKNVVSRFLKKSIDRGKTTKMRDSAAEGASYRTSKGIMARDTGAGNSSTSSTSKHEGKRRQCRSTAAEGMSSSSASFVSLDTSSSLVGSKFSSKCPASYESRDVPSRSRLERGPSKVEAPLFKSMRRLSPDRRSNSTTSQGLLLANTDTSAGASLGTKLPLSDVSLDVSANSSNPWTSKGFIEPVMRSTLSCLDEQRRHSLIDHTLVSITSPPPSRPLPQPAAFTSVQHANASLPLSSSSSLPPESGTFGIPSDSLDIPNSITEPINSHLPRLPSSPEHHLEGEERLAGEPLVYGPSQELQYQSFGAGYFQQVVDGLSEILSSLELGQRDDNFLYEEAVFLLGEMGLHDQHRDMRLDVDNMTYEELLALEEQIGNVSTGLDEEKIRNCLKRKSCMTDANNSPLEIKCSICQDEFEKSSERGVLECGHGYHVACIKQWLSQKNQCPICKVPACL